MGVVADRDISRGELIMTEAPLLTYRGDDATWLENLNAQFEALPRELQNVLFTLHDAFAAPRKTLPGILRTNCFMRGVGSTDGVLCEVASRLNHSCTPNCEHSWDEDLCELQVYASTDIKRNEELTTFYIDVRAPQKDREVSFQDFGFRCNCPACRAPTAESDARRRKLMELVHTTGPVGLEDPRRALHMVSEAMALYEEEGIHINCFRKQACFYAFGLCQRLGDAKAAAGWIQNAASYSILCHGPQHAETLRLHGYADQLRGANQSE